MTHPRHKAKLCILGCGAIGSRIALSVSRELKDYYRLTGVYDSDASKTADLAKAMKKSSLKKNSLKDLLEDCDILVEAVNSPGTGQLIREALRKKKDVLAMSVGRIYEDKGLFDLARKSRRHLLIPSGAIAGIDAVKAAGLKNITRIVLTTRKPLSGFTGLAYLKEKGIDLSRITGETVLFEGAVATAVNHFPRNINVAAVLALASGLPRKILIRIMTSPDYTVNSHEIEITGDFGRLVTRTENAVCPDNPKTSYLAVLSAIQTLKDFGREVRVGT